MKLTFFTFILADLTWEGQDAATTPVATTGAGISTTTATTTGAGGNSTTSTTKTVPINTPATAVVAGWSALFSMVIMAFML